MDIIDESAGRVRLAGYAKVLGDVGGDFGGLREVSDAAGEGLFVDLDVDGHGWGLGWLCEGDFEGKETNI